jgi:serine/threonine protein kinase
LPSGIVMDLYDVSLKNVIDDCGGQPRLSSSVVAVILRNVLDGLRYLHEELTIDGIRGFVHRDLKPGNILLKLASEAYAGPESLDGAGARISDLGTICPVGEIPLIQLGQDGDGPDGKGWKDPTLFRPNGKERPVPALSAHDIYSLGRIMQALAPVTRHDD